MTYISGFKTWYGQQLSTTVRLKRGNRIPERTQPGIKVATHKSAATRSNGPPLTNDPREGNENVEINNILAAEDQTDPPPTTSEQGNSSPNAKTASGCIPREGTKIKAPADRRISATKTALRRRAVIKDAAERISTHPVTQRTTY